MKIRSARKSSFKPGPQGWWWRNLSRHLQQNESFRYFAYWMLDGFPHPARPVGGWTPREKQAFEFLFWLYEIDARVRGEYLFGIHTAALGGDALSAIIRPAHPINGCLPRWVDLLAHDPGQPMGLKADLRAYPTSDNARYGFTSWKYLKIASTGEKSKQPVTINLYRSKRSIHEEFKRRAEDIGFSPPRQKLFALIDSLRAKFQIPEPSPNPQRGERRVRVIWDWVEYLERSAPSEASRASDARRIHRQSCKAIQAWETEAAAILTLEGRRTKT